ncbi:MAG: hypothetical protein ACR2PR_00720 [Pseudohongiellaceae bacterium]
MRYYSLALIFSLILALGLTTCSGPDDESTDITADDIDRFDMTLDMQQLMALVLEPTSDTLWDSAGWILDINEGYRELYPTDDEGWEYVRNRAAIIVETGNMLALPSRAVDNDAWLIYSKGLSQAGLRAMEAAANQDNEEFFQAGAQLYSVCTACHQAYNPEINSRFVSE